MQQQPNAPVALDLQHAPIPAAPAEDVEVGRQLLVAQRAGAARQRRRRGHRRLDQRKRLVRRHEQQSAAKVVRQHGVVAALHAQVQHAVGVVGGALPAAAWQARAAEGR